MTECAGKLTRRELDLVLDVLHGHHFGLARSDYIARAAIVADITAGRSAVGAASTYGLDTAA